MTDQSTADGAPILETGAPHRSSGFSLKRFVRNLEALPPSVVERTGARAILDWEKRDRTSVSDRSVKERTTP